VSRDRHRAVLGQRPTHGKLGAVGRTPWSGLCRSWRGSQTL